MSFFSKLFPSSRSSSPAAPEKSAESFAVETVETPVENPVLSALLADFAQADDQRKPELFEKIAEEIAMNARLLLVIRPFQGKRFEAHPKDKILPRKDGGTIIPMAVAKDGTAYLPVYTDWTELRKGKAYAKNKNVKTLVVSFDEITNIIGGKNGIIADGIVVNVSGDQLMISPGNVLSMKEHKEYLTTGHVRHVVQKDTKVTLGDPAEFPAEMAEAAAKYAQDHPEINAFWLKLMISEEDRSFLLVVDFTGDRQTLFNGLGDAAVPFLPKGYFLDMVSLGDSIGQQAATGEPYYKRP